MSSQGKGYGPIADGIGVAFWIIAALAFSGACGVVMAVSAFVAGLVLG
jgi:hypothetical protein